jgi:hypothetical protein
MRRVVDDLLGRRDSRSPIWISSRHGDPQGRHIGKRSTRAAPEALLAAFASGAV